MYQVLWEQRRVREGSPEERLFELSLDMLAFAVFRMSWLFLKSTKLLLIQAFHRGCSLFLGHSSPFFTWLTSAHTPGFSLNASCLAKHPLLDPLPPKLGPPYRSLSKHPILIILSTCSLGFSVSCLALSMRLSAPWGQDYVFFTVVSSAPRVLPST